MAEWAMDVGTRNYGFRSRMDRQHLCHYGFVAVFVVLAAAILLFHSWGRNEIIQIGYETERMREAHEELQRKEQNLILEIQTLENPQRIDSIARNSLGLVPLSARQVLTAVDAGAGEETVLALSRIRPSRKLHPMDTDN